jgi:hypothetical protein
LGVEVLNSVLVNKTTTLETNDLKKGIYFYEITSGDHVIQTGKLISQH